MRGVRRCTGASRPQTSCLEAAELERLMQQAIETLDEEHRLLIVLARRRGACRTKKSARSPGLPEGTIKSRLHRARMTIKEYLARRTR